MAEFVEKCIIEEELEVLVRIKKGNEARKVDYPSIGCTVSNCFPLTRNFKEIALKNSLCLLKDYLVKRFKLTSLAELEEDVDIYGKGIDDVPLKLLYDEKDVYSDAEGEKKVNFLMNFRDVGTVLGDSVVGVKLIKMTNMYSSFDLDYNDMINKIEQYIKGSRKWDNTKEVEVQDLGFLKDEIKVSLNINCEKNEKKYNYMYMFVFVVKGVIISISECFNTITLKQFIRRVNNKVSQSSLYLKCLLNKEKIPKFLSYMNIIYNEDVSSFNEEFNYEIPIKGIYGMGVIIDDNSYIINESTINIKEELGNIKKLIELERENVNENNDNSYMNYNIEEVIKNIEEVMSEYELNNNVKPEELYEDNSRKMDVELEKNYIKENGNGIAEGYKKLNGVVTDNIGFDLNNMNGMGTNMDFDQLVKFSPNNIGMGSNIEYDPITQMNTGIESIMGVSQMNTGMGSNIEYDPITQMNTGIESIIGVSQMNTGMGSNIEYDPITQMNTGIESIIGVSQMNTVMGSNIEYDPITQMNTGIESIMGVSQMNTGMGCNIEYDPITQINTGIESIMGVSQMNTVMGSNIEYDPITQMNTEIESIMEFDQLTTNPVIESDIDLNSSAPIPFLNLSFCC